MKSVSRLKIGIGFGLMLATLLGTLFFVNEQMERLTRTAENDTAVWDSLQALLRRKDDNTRRLLRMAGRAGDSVIAAADWERVVEQHDTIIVRQQVRRHVVTRRDTLRTPVQPKKGFFKRLGEAFAPPKADTTLQVRVTTEVATDTVTYDTFNPVDSLKEALQEAARKQRERNRREALRQQYRWRMDRMLTTRIDSLLKGHEQEMLAKARAEQELRRKDRLQAARTVGGIATGGIVLAAVFLLLIGRDVTRNNRYRRQTEEAKARAEKLLEERERMMLAITHDFKAPLSSIKGYAELLDRLTDDARQHFYLKAMNDSADHLVKLVTDLLEYHRLERGAVEVERVAFCPARLIEEVANTFRPQTDAKGLKLLTHTAPCLEERFIGVPLRIRQILTNLTGNAVKFTEQGSVSLTADYDPHLRRLVVEVTDTGLGMKPEERDRIWKEFARLPGAQGKEGCGLGLSIVRLLVDLLEGGVEVDSTPGQGSTFRVWIPLYKAPEADTNRNTGKGATALPQQTAKPETRLRHRKLLLIDDDALQLQLTRAMLETAGLESVTCMQVDEVLEALRSESFDALLTDIQMPAISGLDLLRLLRASNLAQARNIPVIAVTARADTERETMIAQGFAGLLHKPFSLKDLAAELTMDIALPTAPPVHTQPAKLDFAALTAYSGDDAEAARDILRSFVDETRRAADRLQQAIEKDNAPDAAAVAHKLIPLFILIGASPVVALLRRLEALKDGTLTPEDQKVATEALEEVKRIEEAAHKCMT